LGLAAPKNQLYSQQCPVELVTPWGLFNQQSQFCLISSSVGERSVSLSAVEQHVVP